MTYAIVLLADDEQQPVETGPVHQLRNVYLLAHADRLGDIIAAGGALVDVDADAATYVAARRAAAERASATPSLPVVLGVAWAASEIAQLVVFAGRFAWRRWCGRLLATGPADAPPSSRMD